MVGVGCELELTDSRVSSPSLTVTPYIYNSTSSILHTCATFISSPASSPDPALFYLAVSAVSRRSASHDRERELAYSRLTRRVSNHAQARNPHKVSTSILSVCLWPTGQI